MRTHLDLFSGIAGFALAARWHGIETVGFCEIDPWCRRVIAKNFPGVPIHGDIATLDARTVRGWADRIDLITGGPPCQPVSQAGKRLGKADDRYLWPEMLRVIAECRPRYVLAENVTGFITMGLDGVLADLEALGYACRPLVIPACAVNAPHRRDRVWIVAHAAGEPKPEPRHETEAVRDQWNARLEFGGSGARFAVGGTETIVAHADANGISLGPQGQQSTRSAAGATLGGGGGLEAESRLGLRPDGLSRRLARSEPVRFRPDWEDGIPRVTAGCPDRVNKLKALGNSIVPLVAYEIMGAMQT